MSIHSLSILEAGLVSPEPSLPGLQIATSSFCPHMVSPLLCVYLPLVSPFPIKTAVIMDQGPTIMSSFNLSFLSKGSSSKYRDILKY